MLAFALSTCRESGGPLSTLEVSHGRKLGTIFDIGA